MSAARSRDVVDLLVDVDAALYARRALLPRDPWEWCTVVDLRIAIGRGRIAASRGLLADAQALLCAVRAPAGPGWLDAVRRAAWALRGASLRRAA